MTLSTYEQISGYTPIPGKPCPDCKFICGSSGPDHSTMCGIVAKLWAHETGRSAAIPQHQLELGANPNFQTWIAKMAGRLFTEPAPAVVASTAPAVVTAAPAPTA